MPRADRNRNRTKTDQNRVKSGPNMTKHNKQALNRPNQKLNSCQCHRSEQRCVLGLEIDRRSRSISSITYFKGL